MAETGCPGMKISIDKKSALFASHTHKPVVYFLDVLWLGLERLYMEVKAFEEEELARLEKRTKTLGGRYKGFFYTSFVAIQTMCSSRTILFGMLRRQRVFFNCSITASVWWEAIGKHFPRY
jgi:hypothetical protein